MAQTNDCKCAAEAARLETIVVEELLRVEALDQPAAFDVLMALNGSALGSSPGKVGLVTGFDHPCFSANPPKWCLAAAEVGLDRLSRQIVIEALTDVGLLDRHAALRTQGRATDLATVVIRRAVKKGALSTDDGFAMLDTVVSIGSSRGLIDPDSPLAAFCREHPTAPLCTLASSPGHERIRDEMAWLAFVQMSVQHKLLEVSMGSAALSAGLDEVAGEAATKVRLHDALTVLRGIGIPNKELPKIRARLVGKYPPDSPWAEICARRPIPEVCKYIHGGVTASFLYLLVEKTKLEFDPLIRTLELRLANGR